MKDQQVLPGEEQRAVYGEKYVPLAVMFPDFAALQMHFPSHQGSVQVDIPVVADCRKIEARQRRDRAFQQKGQGKGPFPFRFSPGRQKNPFRQPSKTLPADNHIGPPLLYQP
ncbi:MAG: hypothetical protein LBD48_02080 [Treponema sp.]|nr:hypothetical protein [Treponema sp.]